MAAWSRKTLKTFEKFLFISKNDPLWWNFSNSVPKVFTVIPIDVLRSNIVKLGRREIGEIVRCLPDKTISPGSPAVATAHIAPKICQGQPPTMYSECSRFHPNRFTFGGVIAEHVNTAERPETRRKVNPIFGRSLASSRIKMIMRSKNADINNWRKEIQSMHSATPSDGVYLLFSAFIRCILSCLPAAKLSPATKSIQSR